MFLITRVKELQNIKKRNKLVLDFSFNPEDNIEPF